MELSRADDEKVNEVPGATVPVLVTVRVGFAGYKGVSCNFTKIQKTHYSPGTGISHPEMKGLATASTSEGEKATSNAWGIALPPLRTLRIVW